MAKHWKPYIARRPVADWIGEGRLPNLEALGRGKFVGDEVDNAAITPRGVPELDSLTKSGGWPNANSLATLRMDDELEKEDRFLLRHYPIALAHQAARAVISYFRPTSEYFSMGFHTPEELSQHSRVAHYWGPFDSSCCMPSESGPVQPNVRRMRVLLAILRGESAGAMVLNTLFVASLFSVLCGKLRRTSRKVRVFVVTLALTILYSLVISTVMEIGENMRFRYETQALVVLIVTLVMWNWHLLRTPDYPGLSSLPASRSWMMPFGKKGKRCSEMAIPEVRSSGLTHDISGCQEPFNRRTA
jgi:hypothetical protein